MEKNDKAVTAPVRATIMKFLTDRLAKVEIRQLLITRDVDADGDPILRVRIVFDGNRDHLEPDETRGLVRQLRPKLADLGEDAFPLFSFIALSEAKEVGAAA